MPRRSARKEETTKNETNDEETEGHNQQASVKKEEGEGEGTVGLVPYELQRLEL
jgi:hypothetical protein